MTELTYHESIRIEASAEAVYDMVADVSRTGEWSPVCTACWWDEPEQGAVVVAADPGREFAFIVGGKLVRWGYSIAELEGDTELTESWEFLPAGIAFFHDKYGAQAEVEIAKRIAAAHTGIPATLAAIKRIAESA